jgi:hypothetical protein
MAQPKGIKKHDARIAEEKGSSGAVKPWFEIRFSRRSRQGEPRCAPAKCLAALKLAQLRKDLFD